MEDDILAPFLKPVRDITQNFDINLVELLEDYLNKIGISDTEAEAVLDSKDFAEAAIVLQQSANIYGKKVDFLWQLLMQVLHKNKLVRGKIAAEKNNGQKQPDLYFSPDFCEIDDETLFCDDVNINISNEHFSEIKFLPKYNPQLEGQSSGERSLILYGSQLEMIGKKYDFRVNRYLSSEGLLVDEPLLHKEATVCHSFPQEFSVCTSSRMEETVPVGGMLFEDDNVLVNDCHILEPFQDCCLPDNDSEYTKSRCSKEGSACKSAACHRESDKVINIYEEAWKPWPFDKVVPNKKFVKTVTFRVPPDLVNVKDEEIKRKVFDESMETRRNCSSIFSFMRMNFERRARKSSNQLIDGEYLYLLHGLNKLQPEQHTPILSEFQAQFKEMTKKLAEEFNDIHCCSDDDETRDAVEDKAIQEEVKAVDDDDDDSFTGAHFDVGGEDNVENWEMFVNNINLPTLNQLGENDMAYDQYALETCSIIPLETELLQGTSSKVREWHDKLGPRLKSASERGHFDINAYGAKIINSFPGEGAETNQSTLSFGDIVKDEPSTDVPRFFLAALMLANSYNVEISKSGESQLEMDCVKLTLLSPSLNHAFGETSMQKDDDVSS